MSSVQYKLGRDAVATLPGVDNTDIVDVTITSTGTQLDVTTFKNAAITRVDYMVGLIDVTIDVTCTDHDATIGQAGTQVVAGLPSDYEAEVVDIKESVNPKGRVEFTITYTLFEPEAS